MNVFYTNKCPIEAAYDHNKVHQVKMIVEYLFKIKGFK
jgi:hypothetical protein